MRIKLSYTVDEKDVLGEAAKLLGLAAHDVQMSVNLFGDVQTQLRAEGAPEPLDPAEDDDTDVIETIRRFRNALLNVDTRLSEVQDIVLGYRDHIVNSSAEQDPHDAAAEFMKDNFGAD